jgi:predicted branched-subunit amino acid permease
MKMQNKCLNVNGIKNCALNISKAQISLVGLDFALAALFAVLAIEQWRNAASAAPLWVAVVSYAIAWALLPQQALLAAIGLSVLAGLLWRKSVVGEVRP